MDLKCISKALQAVYRPRCYNLSRAPDPHQIRVLHKLEGSQGRQQRRLAYLRIRERDNSGDFWRALTTEGWGQVPVKIA
jgi:hypothetical protein